MKKNIIIAAVVLILVVAVWVGSSSKKSMPQVSTGNAPSNSDFLNTTYVIGGQSIPLIAGVSQIPVNLGQGKIATLITKAAPGGAVKGDFNGDGTEDAAIFMAQKGNGDGIFYYVVASLQNADKTVSGTDAIFLGDRVAPQNILYSSGVLAINYVDRKPGEALTVAPSVPKTKFVTVNQKKLIELNVASGEKIIAGSIVAAGDVSEFTPCGEKVSWISTNSPSFKDIKDVYAQVFPNANKPYSPVFGVLIGKDGSVPKTGAGSTYKKAFIASQLINMNPGLRCN